MTPAKLHAIVDLDTYAARMAKNAHHNDPAPSADPAADLAFLQGL
jgi:hypothetical protein